MVNLKILSCWYWQILHFTFFDDRSICARSKGGLKMKNYFKVGVIIVFALAGVACGSGSHDAALKQMDEGKEVAKINGHIIHQGYLDLLAKINPRVQAQLDNPFTRGKLIENLIDQELMYYESLDQGLDASELVNQKAALYKRVVISQALLDREMASQAQDYYDKNKDTEFTKIKIAQIQVSFPDKPKEKKGVKKEPPSAADKQAALAKINLALERIKKGEDFAKVAGEVSDDKMSQSKGGDMGEISKMDKRLVRHGLKDLGEKAFALKKDEVSEPIESRKGYHVVKVLSEPTLMPFDEAKKLIELQIQKGVRTGLLKKLREKADIAYAEKPLAEKPAEEMPKVELEEPHGTIQPTANQPAVNGN